MTAFDDYARRVREVLAEILGPQLVNVVLYYTGNPDQATFGEKLKLVFGEGAKMITKEIDKRVSKSEP